MVVFFFSKNYCMFLYTGIEDFLKTEKDDLFAQLLSWRYQSDVVQISICLILTKLWLRGRSYERRNELILLGDLKTAWKQVLFTWRFISAAFQNDSIFWWTCVVILFRVLFLSNFCQNDRYEIHTHYEF